MGLVRRIGRRLLGRGGEAAAAPAPARRERVRSEAARACRLVDLGGIREATASPGRLLVVNHWATWCEGCVEELPVLVELHRRHGERVGFLGIGWEPFSFAPSADDALEQVRDFTDAHALAWPTLVFSGEPEALFEGLSLEEHVIPQTVVLAPDGTVRFRHVGVLEGEAVAGLEASLR